MPDYLSDPPVDLWSGEQKLMRYTIRPGGRAALWSIGENQIDENGFVGDHGSGDGDDIIWRHYEIAPDDPDHPDRVAERVARRRKATKR